MNKNVSFSEDVKVIIYEDYCDRGDSCDLIAKQRFEDYLYNLENRLTLFIDQTFYPIKSFFKSNKKKNFGKYHEV